MPDGFDARVLYRATQKSMSDIERRTRRATMFVAREAGREVRREAKRRAPVYKGANATRRMRKGEAGPLDNPNKPVTGLLRASIAVRKRLERAGEDTYVQGVAPRGARVHLYSQKVEGLHHYMSDALDVVMPRMEAIARKAWARSTRGRR